MGMFDTVVVTCPKCGNALEFQSKSGPCMLKRYKYTSVPAAIAESLAGKSDTCSCGQYIRLEFSGAPIRVSMSIVTDDEEFD